LRGHIFHHFSPAAQKQNRGNEDPIQFLTVDVNNSFQMLTPDSLPSPQFLSWARYCVERIPQIQALKPLIDGSSAERLCWLEFIQHYWAFDVTVPFADTDPLSYGLRVSAHGPDLRGRPRPPMPVDTSDGSAPSRSHKKRVKGKPPVLSLYNFFVRKRYPALEQGRPGIPAHDLIRELVAEWKDLSPAARAEVEAEWEAARKSAQDAEEPQEVPESKE
jgi:hypothetical protein